MIPYVSVSQQVYDLKNIKLMYQIYEDFSSKLELTCFLVFFIH